MFSGVDTMSIRAHLDTAEEVYGITHRAEARIDEVKDGDSYVGARRVDPGLVLEDEPYNPEFRLLGVDTHEIYRAEGEELEKGLRERDFVRDWMKKGEEESDSEFPFIIEYPAKDPVGSFGRLLVTVIRKSDGSCLNEEVLNTFEDVEYE